MKDEIFKQIKEMNKKRKEKREKDELFTKKYTETFKEALAGRNVEVMDIEYYDTIYGPASYLKTFEDVTIYLYPHMEKDKFAVNYDNRNWSFNSLSAILLFVETLH